MAKRKRKGQLSLNLRIKDERIKKLFGLLLLFIAVYLFIAFTSYLFTWREDQSNVLRFSWDFLQQGDLGAANWLGRLGAIVSNMFFFWGFGLPSFIFVFVFGLLGLNILKGKSFRENIPTIWNSFLVLLLLSILMEFLFSSSSFPYGGAFGKSTTTWLLKFVGSIGVVALMIFSVLVGIIWYNNPDFNNITLSSIGNSIQVFFSDLFSGRIFSKRKTRKPSVRTASIDAPNPVSYTHLTLPTKA